MAVTPSTRTIAPDRAAREVTGVARLGSRTKRLVKRLRPGDVAVVDHAGIDRVSAEDLIAAGAVAVINRAPSSSARYPNLGPLLLVQAGLVLVDAVGADLFGELCEGEPVTLRGGEVWSRGRLVARGQEQRLEEVQRRTERQREQIGEALEAFARNTVEHMVAERDLLAGGLELPRLETELRDRPVLVVVRGVDHKRDLRALRPYIRDVKPVLIAVDGGADAILEEGFVPDMIVGDMDSAGEQALRCGAELVVHAYPDGHAPGRRRLERLGLVHKVIPAPATSQDVAMLLAAEKGARLIVSVGTHFNLVEFLDRNRAGMSSTFLTRLRIGEILVDAKGVSRLYRPRPGVRPILLLLAAGLVTFVIVVLATPDLRAAADLLWLKLELLLGLGA